MTINAFTALACPLDGAPLVREGMSWRCADGHCYDIAGQGYSNLLPVQLKRSRDPGDSKEMVAARRRFLNAGHYQPIADAVARLTLDGLPDRAACLDAGSGEGYYLRRLAAIAEQQGQSLAVLGLDISKWAVLVAAKQDKLPTWVVGSNARLPILDGTLDRLLCLFGFPVYTEFARVLRPGGQLIQVDAGPDHLAELRAIIYPTLKAERPAKVETPAGFQPIASENQRFGFTLHGQEPIADLLAMTPHLFRASAEGKARLAALNELALTADVRLTRYAKTG